MRLHVLAALAVFCAPVSAAQRGPWARPALNFNVSPALVGSLYTPGHPLVQRLEYHAQDVLNLAGHLNADEDAVRRKLTLMSDDHSHVADRLTAAALARLTVEPSLGQALAHGNPAFVSSPIQLLPQALIANSPYRGMVGGQNSTITRLADAAVRDPAAAALFDPRVLRVGLNDAGVGGDNLFIAGKKSASLGWTHGGTLYAHPDMDGVSIEVFGEPLAANAPVLESLPPGELLMDKIAALGYAPRTLGRDVVFTKGFGPKPMRMTALRERVYGRSLANIVMDGRIAPEVRAQTRAALIAYMTAGGNVWELKPGHIVLGVTLLRPETRAYIFDATPLVTGKLPGNTREEIAEMWLNKLEFDASVWRAKANSGLAGMKF